MSLLWPIASGWLFLSFQHAQHDPYALIDSAADHFLSYGHGLASVDTQT